MTTQPHTHRGPMPQGFYSPETRNSIWFCYGSPGTPSGFNSRRPETPEALVTEASRLGGPSVRAIRENLIHHSIHGGPKSVRTLIARVGEVPHKFFTGTEPVQELRKTLRCVNKVIRGSGHDDVGWRCRPTTTTDDDGTRRRPTTTDDRRRPTTIDDDDERRRGRRREVSTAPVTPS